MADTSNANGGAYIPGMPLGKPASVDLTNATNVPTNFVGGNTGTGAVVMATSPTITTPTLSGTVTGGNLVPSSVKGTVVASTGATVTITAAQSGSTFLFDRNSGVTYTLPAPSAGLSYQFVVTTSVTSNNHKIITDAGTTLFIGSVWLTIAAGTGTQFFANGSTHIAITQNGTTTGGLINSIINLTCVSATQWIVDATLEGSGTIATPFATS